MEIFFYVKACIVNATYENLFFYKLEEKQKTSVVKNLAIS